MKKIIFIIVFLLPFFQVTAWAQDNRPFNDLEKIRRPMSAHEIDSAAQKVFNIAKTSPDSAIEQLNALYQESERSQYNRSTANILLLTGSVYTKEKGAPVIGIRYYNKAYSYLNAISDTSMKLHIKWYGNMGGALIVQGWFDSALIYLSKALALRLQYDPNNLSDLAAMYISMGAVYKNMHKLDKALFYLKKAEEIAASKKFTNWVFYAYNNLIMVFIEQRDATMANLYLQKMKALNIGSQEWKDRVNIMQGKVLIMEDRYKEAIPYLQNVLASGTKDVRTINTATEIIGDAYFAMKNYKMAKPYFESLLKDALKAGLDGPQLLSCYDRLGEISKGMENYKEAYKYAILEANLQYRMTTKARQNSADELEIKYRTLEKEKELNSKQLQLVSAENNLNKKNTQVRGIVSAALILLFISAFFIQRQNWKLQKARIREKEQKIEQLNAVIEAEEKERSRIGYQLHDDVMLEFSLVKMNMTTFSEQHPYLAVMTQYTNITQQLDRASIKLRQTARNLMPETVLEDGLVAAIHYFCNSVQKISNLHFTFQNYSDLPKLPIETEVSLYRMVQELIQNVIKHAEASAVLIQIGHRAGTINITVEDNGRGIDNLEQPREGMGLKGIQSRLQAIKGVIDIYNIKPHGTSANIEVQI